MRVLSQFVEDPRPCSYLPDRTARLEYKVLLDTTVAELEALLVRGWRRFGPQFFRPSCAPCHECVPTRLPVASFTPSKSQRRARRSCDHLRLAIGAPCVDEERLELYRAWHADRERARDWPPSPLGARDYFLQFAFPHPAARELAYYDESGPSPRLVGLGICDETPRVWSAVYFFYHPDLARSSLGVAHEIFQVELARARGIPHVYLGFRVDGCRSMTYKARFQPQERLVGWPGPDEEPVWRLREAGEVGA